MVTFLIGLAIGVSIFAVSLWAIRFDPENLGMAQRWMDASAWQDDLLLVPVPGPWEAIPEGATLLLHNHDRPGVVGKVGSVLGEAGVNISRMQLALVNGEAAMLVNIDAPPAESVMEQLRSLDNMISAQLVDLGR